MASYRYLQDINPETNIEPTPDPPKKDKIKNWWYYNKIKLISAIVLLVIFIYFIVSMVTQTRPDYTVGIISPNTFPDNFTAQLSKELTPFFDDKNDDGKVVVDVITYTIQFSPENIQEDGKPIPSTNTANSIAQSATTQEGIDPNMQMAGVTKLSGSLSSGEDYIFLLDPTYADLYQYAYSICGYPDGTMAATDVPVSDLAYQVKNCPTLLGLDLTYQSNNGTIQNGFTLLENYYIGLRPVYGTSNTKEKAITNWEINSEIYKTLTENATLSS